MMVAIKTEALHKRYRTRVKEAGLKASFGALFHPHWQEIEAVKSIDLTVEQGEIVAFIGPNGAGKSTTIKMLCGILRPTSGQIAVLGMSPMENRRKLTAQLGTVFGQKSQLWLHLPAVDSFSMLGAIYGVTDLKARINELADLFALGPFLNTSVRRLSLGQRIRCEVAASLLHDPQILFLDEPTIGLDVVVKQTIRELILRRNRENGTTIFLTSHDPADIEHLCNRAVVIHRGQVILDAPVRSLQSEYLGQKVLQITFSTPLHLDPLEGVDVRWEADGLRARLTVDTRIRPIGQVLAAIPGGNVMDITVSNPPMEEVITAIYAQGGEQP